MNEGQPHVYILAYNLALSGRNIFITGSEGTGKSYLFIKMVL